MDRTQASGPAVLAAPTECAFVYILSTPSYPGWIKVGFTERSVGERCRELSSASGVKDPFKVEAVFEVARGRGQESEKLAHVALEPYARKKEFFSCAPGKAISILQAVLSCKGAAYRDIQKLRDTAVKLEKRIGWAKAEIDSLTRKRRISQEHLEADAKNRVLQARENYHIHVYFNRAVVLSLWAVTVWIAFEIKPEIGIGFVYPGGFLIVPGLAHFFPLFVESLPNCDKEIQEMNVVLSAAVQRKQNVARALAVFGLAE